MREPSGAVYIVDGTDIIRERRQLGSREVVYSYEYLLSSGNRWMQALDKREIENRVIATRALDLFYDDQSGNLIVAMGLQGVVVVTPDGTSTRVAVGPYSPTDFSFGSKVRTYVGSLLLWEMARFTGVAFLLTFSFAALALAFSAASETQRFYLALTVNENEGAKAEAVASEKRMIYLILAAAISAVLAVSVGVYPNVLEEPSKVSRLIVGYFALVASGFGLIPLLLALRGLGLSRTNFRQVLAVATASIGMLLLVEVGVLVLFETGALIANFVAVGMVALAALGLWAYQKRR